MRFASSNGLSIDNRGLAAPEGNTNGRNVFRGIYRGAAAGTLRVEAQSAEPGPQQTELQVAAGQEAGFELPYRVQGVEGEQLRLRVALDGGALYDNAIPVQRITTSRVWVTQQPVYEELVGDAGPGMASQGVIMWGHDLIDYEMATYCMKYAQPFVLEDSYRNAARRNLRYIMNGSFLPKNIFRSQEYADKYGLKFILQGNTRAHAEGSPLEGDSGWLFDPANQEVFLSEIREYLQGPYGKYVWAVMTADEQQLTAGLRASKGPYNTWTGGQGCARAFGLEYGLPMPEDKDPFRWIAYRRWLNAVDFERI